VENNFSRGAFHASDRRSFHQPLEVPGLSLKCRNQRPDAAFDHIFDRLVCPGVYVRFGHAFLSFVWSVHAFIWLGCQRVIQGVIR